jgi:calcium load-activated calcium channel
MTFADAANAWLLIATVVGAIFASEMLCWLVVYRQPEYKRACTRVVDLTKKFEKEEAKLVAVDKRKAHERNLARLEEECKEETNKMNGMKMRSTIFSSLAFFILYRTVASSYGSVVVARLPFVPFPLLQNLTHRGVDGVDVCDCGFGFIYTLATMGIKSNVPRIFGFVAPRSAFDASKAAIRAAAKADSEDQ